MRRWLIVVVTLPFLLSCEVSYREGYIEDDKQTIEAKIEQFHVLFNNGDFSQIIADAHPEFARQGEDKLNSAMAGTKAKYGNFISVTEKWINIITEPPVQARAVYNSDFDNSDTTETFVFVLTGEDFRLVQYRIFPGTTKPPS